MPDIRSLKPGVVTGDDYRTLVEACKEGGFALPAVNVVDVNTANAAMEAAQKNGSAIIIQASNGGAQFFAGPGMKDTFKAKALGAISLARHVHLMAPEYGVPVVLHTDHANKKLIPWVEAMMIANEENFSNTGRTLYSSHMLDLSEEALEENIELSAKMLKRMAKVGMSLEIELGVTGGAEDGVGKDHESAENPKLYTQPEHVLQAFEVLSPLGHFSTAAAFGNVHGVYKSGAVKLRPEILKACQAMVSAKHGGNGANPLHLVFHGGSGSDPAQIKEAIGYGVFKMNIDTDTQFAFTNAVAGKIIAAPTRYTHQLEPGSGEANKEYYDPRKLLREGQKGFAARLGQAFVELESKGSYSTPEI